MRCSRKLTAAGGTVALAKMPIPTVGWLAYGKDTEGNLFGMMQMRPECEVALDRRRRGDRGRHCCARLRGSPRCASGRWLRHCATRAALPASEARPGRVSARRAAATVRGDRIAWLDEAPSTPAETASWPFLRRCAYACNRELLLGLFDFEGHYALYPPGRRLRAPPRPLPRRRRARSFVRAVSQRRVAPRRRRRAAPVRERRRSTRRPSRGRDARRLPLRHVRARGAAGDAAADRAGRLVPRRRVLSP